MIDPKVLTAARLRGSLPGEPLGSRGLEHAARNPGCKRLRALTLVSLSPSTAVGKIYAQPAKEGQSPFALGIGTHFEARLFDQGAARLLDLYRKEGVLSAREVKVVSIPDLAPGNRPVDRGRRLAETERLLRMKLRGDPRAPNLIIKPLLPVTFIGRHIVEPDALRASDKDTFFRPVEIKSYPNRGGKTSEHDLRNAFRQSAVAVIALRQAIASLTGRDPARIVQARTDIILRKPGRLAATLTADQAIDSEVFAVTRAVDEAPRDLQELEALIPTGASLDDVAVLDSIPNLYRPSCREFCALAPVCKSQAVRNGDPVLLGDTAREELAPAGSLGRVFDLLSGRGTPPSDEERLLLERLVEGAKALRRAVGHGV